MNMDNNENNILLLCFDPNNEIEHLKTSDLNQINEDFIFYHQSESCLSFVQSTKNQKIFLIIPPSQTTASIIDQHQIACIFIVSLSHDQLSYRNPKVVGAYDHTESLFSAIQEQVNFVERQNRIWCLFDQREFHKKDLSRLANEFLWFQLFHGFLLHLPIEQQIKKQKIEIFSIDYQYNAGEHSLINELKIRCRTADTLQRFITDPSLQKMINKALQTRNITLLYDIRFYLTNLLHSLNSQHKKTVQCNQEKRTLYRTMQLSGEELEQLKQSQGQLILMKGFLIAHSHQLLSIDQMDPQSVLVQIECHPKELGDDFVFADVSQFTESSSNETILFDFNATFRLESVTQTNRIWTMKLSAVTDGKSIVQKYIDDTHRQGEDLSIPILFGQLLCDMCEWNESQRYFQRLKSDLPDEDAAWIEYCIGETYHWLGKWDEAREYYDRAYDQMMQSEPSRIKESASILNDIGNILNCQGKYDQSLEYYERASTIRKQYYSSNHVNTAICLKNIAFIHSQHEKNDEALVLYKEALAILNKYYDYFHLDVATVLVSIGSIVEDEENYDEALHYYQQALSMYKVYHPSGHVSISKVLNHISYVLRRQEKYSEAYRRAKEALQMQKKFYPNGHIKMVISSYNIVRAERRLNASDSSLEVCENMLKVEEKYYSSGHMEVIRTLNIIGFIHLYEKQNYDQSLHYYQQALSLLETHYPSYRSHIAMALNNIGNVLRKQSKHDEALDYYNRSLEMQENYYLSDRTNMSDVLNSIATILVEQGNNEEALVHLQRALAIREKYHPSHHINVAFFLRNIGDVKLKQRQFNEALEYLQKALVIFEQYYATNFKEIHLCLELIGDVFWLQTLYDRSEEYLKRCLSLNERCFPSAYSKTIRMLFNLGLSHRLRSQYQSSLVYEINCLLVQEQVLPPNHQEIGESLRYIGTCYHALSQRKLALEYFHRSLGVYQQCLPSEHAVRKNLEAMIRQVRDELQITNT